jgi:hypothetical protein
MILSFLGDAEPCVTFALCALVVFLVLKVLALIWKPTTN